ncbi:hypothetical protein D918_06589 [Trichuris suis]|nr:hypothetical protein D918_06589 [Trichuris suis]
MTVKQQVEPDYLSPRMFTSRNQEAERQVKSATAAYAANDGTLPEETVCLTFD